MPMLVESAFPFAEPNPKARIRRPDPLFQVTLSSGNLIVNFWGSGVLVGLERRWAMKLRRLICTFALLGVCAALAYGQAVTGSIVGTVTDASGASVPSAKVTI